MIISGRSDGVTGDDELAGGGPAHQLSAQAELHAQPQADDAGRRRRQRQQGGDTEAPATQTVIHRISHHDDTRVAIIWRQYAYIVSEYPRIVYQRNFAPASSKTAPALVPAPKFRPSNTSLAK